MNNSRLFIIVEGETEAASLPVLLDGYFRSLGIRMQCILVGTLKKKDQGGNFNLKMFDDHLHRLLNGHQGCFITTFFDYYALGNNWPEYRDIHIQKWDVYKKLDALEAALARHTEKKYGSGTLWQGHFVPYIQLHEFETLLFSYPEATALVFNDPKFANAMKNIVKDAHHNCELINDNYASCPSRRLADLTDRRYVKGKSSRAQAPIILKHIGLETIRKKCRHFDKWLTTLTLRLGPNIHGSEDQNQ